jgi:hypothetical protein
MDRSGRRDGALRECWIMDDATPSTGRKALAINLDPVTYGVFTETGGGQEVARWFFEVGGAAGTVAKTISAYDMAMGDAIYGEAPRYVSRQRLEAMLEHEFAQVTQQLGPRRGDTTTFFAFADTVTTRSYRRQENGRGWVGIRFQANPHAPPSEIIVHIHLLDATPAHQREALGVLGVNLIHGAFFTRQNPSVMIGTLMEDLSRGRVEIDLIKFSGPAFPDVDNRLMALQLVEQGLTDAAMLEASGNVVQPSDVLHKKPILVERGSFRPATNLTLDLLERARELFLKEPGVAGQAPVVLAEMTVRNLMPGNDVGHADFLARADILRALGLDVLISRFEPYYELAEYLAAYTDRLIGIAVGLPSVRQIADEHYYTDLPGGVLEAAGRLFKRSVKLYVYPTRDAITWQIQSVQTAAIAAPWHHLRDLLLEIGRFEPIRHYNEAYLSIRTPDVLARIQAGDESWEAMVPAVVADTIRAKRLFGYHTGAMGGGH